MQSVSDYKSRRSNAGCGLAAFRSDQWQLVQVEVTLHISGQVLTVDCQVVILYTFFVQLEGVQIKSRHHCGAFPSFIFLKKFWLIFFSSSVLFFSSFFYFLYFLQFLFFFFFPEKVHKILFIPEPLCSQHWTPAAKAGYARQVLMLAEGSQAPALPPGRWQRAQVLGLAVLQSQ